MGQILIKLTFSIVSDFSLNSIFGELETKFALTSDLWLCRISRAALLYSGSFKGVFLCTAVNLQHILLLFFGSRLECHHIDVCAVSKPAHKSAYFPTESEGNQIKWQKINIL